MKTHVVKPDNFETGFSAVEIVVVLAVLLVLAAVAVPSITHYLQAHRLDTSAGILGSKLSEARMDAIKRNRQSRLQVDLATGTARIRSTDAANAAISVGSPEILPPNIVLDSDTSIDIAFDSMGRIPAGSQTIIIRETSSSKRKSIVVSPAGRVVVGAMY